MTIVVTGASGHVGAALVRRLLADGARVRALVRSDTRALEGLDVDVRKVDVVDRAAVVDALRDAEVVYHAAARLTLEAEADPEADRVNVEGTRNVLEGARRAGTRRFVHFSTAHALHAGTGDLLAVDAGMPYERSKASAEREVHDAIAGGLDAVVVSPCAVVGPHDYKPSYIGRVLLMIARGLLPATVDGGQSWVDVRDVADAAVRAALGGRRGARYVVGGHWLPMHDFATLASRVVGSRPPLVRIPRGLARPFAPIAARASRALRIEPLFTEASLEALGSRPRPPDEGARVDLSHAPRPLEQTLRDTFAWFEGRGQLSRRRKS